MKKITIVFLLALFLAAVTFAQSNVHYSLGIRYQLASWEYKSVYTYDSNGDSSQLGSETGHLYGPVVSLNYQKFSFSVTYLMGSWEYPDMDTFVILYDPYTGLYYWDDDILTLTTKRSDLVVTAAYQVIPRVSVFVGFKNLTMKHEFKYVNYTDANFDIEQKGSGIGGGVSGSMPFTPKLHGYATVGYMSLGGDFDTENLILEGGLRMFFGTAPMFGSLGYRYESFDSGDTILHGPILTLAFYK